MGDVRGTNIRYNIFNLFVEYFGKRVFADAWPLPDDMILVVGMDSFEQAKKDYSKINDLLQEKPLFNGHNRFNFDRWPGDKSEIKEYSDFGYANLSYIFNTLGRFSRDPKLLVSNDSEPMFGGVHLVKDMNLANKVIDEFREMKVFHPLYNFVRQLSENDLPINDPRPEKRVPFGFISNCVQV